MSGVDVLTEIDIRRAVGEVAAFAVEPENATQWCENIVRAEWRTEPPSEVGSVFCFEARFFGRTLS